MTIPTTEDPILALKREWDARLERYKNEPNRSDEEIIGRLHDRIIEAEYAVYRTPATTPEGIAIKLRMWGRNHPDPDRGENWCEPPVKDIEGNLDDMPILSVLCDLDHMTRRGVPTVVTETDTNLFAALVDEPLLALERRWREALKTFAEATPESPPKPSPDDMTAAISDVQEEIAVTSARTIAGILVKLRVYGDLNAKPSNGVVMSIDQLPFVDLELDEALVRGAMRDLEHLAPTTTVAEIPPAEDTALFDALAEYDRLTAISQGLEHRTKIFRPGIPEAKEADKVFEAAYDRTTEAWVAVRGTPATTQAELFAKLQATIRFMADLESDEMLEAEWSAIKADMQRIGGEARP